MPSRNLSRIRRDINRFHELIQRVGGENPSLDALGTIAAGAAHQVNQHWVAFQETAVGGGLRWNQRWRPVVIMRVPGASENLRNLPASGATPDDTLRVIEDLTAFIESNPACEPFRAAALADLEPGIDQIRTEIEEASAMLPLEAAARAAYSEACLAANQIVVRGSEAVRAVFGPKSPEYKQFVQRGSSSEEQQDDQDAELGEG